MTTSGVKTETTARPSSAEIVEWCQKYVGQVLNLPPEKIDPKAEFDALGLDSAVAVALVAEVGTWLQMDLEPAVLFEYSTISTFAEHLAQR